MKFYSKCRKDIAGNWESYINEIYYTTESNRAYYIDMLSEKCRSSYAKLIQTYNIPEVSIELVLEYIQASLKFLQSDYSVGMAKANGLDDSETIKHLKLIYKKLKKGLE